MKCTSRILIVLTCMWALLVTGFAADNEPQGNIEIAGVGGTLLYLPFINNGDDLLTTITIVNRDIVAATGTISFFDDTGVPMPLEINGNPPASVINFSLPPNGRADYATNAVGDTPQTGSATVRSTAKVGAAYLFGHSNLCPAGTGPSAAVTGFIAPARKEGTRITLLAIMDVDANPVTLRVQLYDNSGMLVGTANTGIAGNGRIARYLNALFPAVENFQGSVVVTATGGRIAAVGMDVDAPARQFIMLPVTPL